MRLLLDTHTLIWFYLDDPRLGRAARTAILDPNHETLVSPASFWEIAIKISKGNYLLNESYDDFIQGAIFDNAFAIPPIEPKHTSALTTLGRHHNDPFDRLLIAQAIVEDIPLVSVDAHFDAYPITRLW